MKGLGFFVQFISVMLFACFHAYSQDRENKGIFYWGFTMQYPTVEGTITYLFRDNFYASSQPSSEITADFKEGKPLFGASLWYNQPVFNLNEHFSIGATGDFTPSISMAGNIPLQGSLSAFLTARYGLGDRYNSKKKFGGG